MARSREPVPVEPDPPNLGTTVVRAVFVIGFSITGLALASSSVPGVVLASVCFTLVLRSCAVTVRVTKDGVLVRNLARTHRVPISEVEQFAECHSAIHGGPVLSVLRGPKGAIKVTAYPLTLVDRIATRRRSRVIALNEWLVATRSE